jgi:outer membrane protein OmpA-like peptidoglycan-associated protein
VLTSTLVAWLACGAPAFPSHAHPTDRPWIGDTEIGLPQPITFGPGSFDVVEPEQQDLLDDMGTILGNHPEILEIEVHGRAGAVEAADDRTLVKRRAESIKARLVQKGVAPTRIATGSEVAANPDDTGFTFPIRRGLGASRLCMRRPLNFFPMTASFGPENDEPLGDALTVLTMKPDLRLDVQVTGAPTGPEAVPLEIKQQRAEAVVAWLGARGIDPSRLFPLGVEPDETWVPGDDVRLLIHP